ncbi:uncharacterized protein LOC144359091 [Saccoglossus kowalevskii]
MAASSRASHEVRKILQDQLTRTSKSYNTYVNTEEQYDGVWYVTPECGQNNAAWEQGTELFTVEWMRHSVFCLQPPGDSPTRKSFYDSVTAHCIPVIFLPEKARVKYPFQRLLNYSEFTVNFGLETFLLEKPDIVDLLRKIPEDYVIQLQNNLLNVSKRLQYSYPSNIDSDDAFQMILDELGAIYKLQV